MFLLLISILDSLSFQKFPEFSKIVFSLLIQFSYESEKVLKKQKWAKDQDLKSLPLPNFIIVQLRCSIFQLYFGAAQLTAIGQVTVFEDMTKWKSLYLQQSWLFKVKGNGGLDRSCSR